MMFNQLVTSSVQAIVLYVIFLSSVNALNGEDVSSYLQCTGLKEVQPNERACFRVRIDGDPCTFAPCNATQIPRTSSNVTFEPFPLIAGALQAKLWSPGKIRDTPRNYQNNRVCRYHLACPPGFFLYFGFRTGNFDLEPENSRCLDYVHIEDLSQGSLRLCGTQTQTTFSRGVPLRVEFRSNTQGRYPGFQIDAICSLPEVFVPPNCTQVDDSTFMQPTMTRGRKRSATMAMEKRMAIPLIGNKVSVPRQGFITYDKNLVQVIVDDKVIREFRSIERFFFWTGYNGTRLFRRSTDEFIFGSGKLLIVKKCAYYYTLDIPPQFEPTQTEADIISFLLNATVPFFRDQDIPEEPPTVPPTFKPTVKPTVKPHKPYTQPTRFPPHLGLNPWLLPLPKHLHYKRQAAADPRVDPNALSTANQFQNACNVFLRDSARSYLLITTQTTP